MLKQIREMLSREEGFTLVELMLVVAILGIIAGVAIPRITGVRDEAQIAALRSSANTIRNAMERQFSIDGQYPTLSSTANLSNLNDDIDNTDISGDFTVDSMSSTPAADEYSIKISGQDSSTPSVTINQDGLTIATN